MLSPDKGEPASSLLRWGILAKSSYLFLVLTLSSILYFFLSICLFIYLWLCWVFVSVRGHSLVVASGGPSSSRCAGLSLSRPLLLRSTGSIFTFLRLFPPQLYKGIFKERQMQEFGVGQIGFGPPCCLC